MDVPPPSGDQRRLARFASAARLQAVELRQAVEYCGAGGGRGGQALHDGAQRSMHDRRRGVVAAGVCGEVGVRGAVCVGMHCSLGWVHILPAQLRTCQHTRIRDHAYTKAKTKKTPGRNPAKPRGELASAIKGAHGPQPRQPQPQSQHCCGWRCDSSSTQHG